MKLPSQTQDLFRRLRARVAGEDLDAGATEAREAPRDPVVRRMNFPFDAEVPRYWVDGSVIGTAIGNALNLLFPDGERFFVRSVHYYLDEIEDPQLRERVRRFFGQEGQHAREHERYYEVMRAHGIDIDAFLEPYRRVAYRMIEPAASPKLRLAVTAALEHYTASFAEWGMRDGYIERVAAPVMADLLMWHAAEEIEHKDVAYDVLLDIDDRYIVRAVGMVVATAILAGFWLQAVVTLLAQEPRLTTRSARRELGTMGVAGIGPVTQMPRAFLTYLVPGFHPAKVANDHLAQAYLERIGRATG